MFHFELFGVEESVLFAHISCLHIGEIGSDLWRSTFAFETAWSDILAHSSSWFLN
jgi:hypothetical protein